LLLIHFQLHKFSNQKSKESLHGIEYIRKRKSDIKISDNFTTYCFGNAYIRLQHEGAKRKGED